MNKIFLVVAFLATVCYRAQSENEIINLVARACQTDSLNKVLGYVQESDSIPNFDFVTPELGTSLEEYDFDSFKLAVGLKSSGLMKGTPYGKIYIRDVSKKKLKMIVQLNGVGDRLSNAKWTFAIYSYVRPKHGNWMLSGVEYKFHELSNEDLK